MDNLDYRIVVQPLSEEDGGGFIATVPDLPGCMSDGETQAEAVQNVLDAIRVWQDRARAMDRPVPRPARQSQYA
ncbi:MAG: type II toxin-antitoxin system HicB family antitoxin [Methylocella sp.]